MIFVCMIRDHNLEDTLIFMCIHPLFIYKGIIIWLHCLLLSLSISPSLFLSLHICVSIYLFTSFPNLSFSMQHIEFLYILLTLPPSLSVYLCESVFNFCTFDYVSTSYVSASVFSKPFLSSSPSLHSPLFVCFPFPDSSVSQVLLQCLFSSYLIKLSILLVFLSFLSFSLIVSVSLRLLCFSLSSHLYVIFSLYLYLSLIFSLYFFSYSFHSSLSA